jgi:hypothetical protein
MRAEEFLPEKVNPLTVNKGFRQEKTILDGRYRLVATGEDREGLKYLVIRAYPADLDAVSNNEVGFVLLRLHEPKKPNEEAYLKATMVRVSERHQKQGIASAMYDYAEELGNDLMKSDNLLPDGQALWAARDRKKNDSKAAA